MENMEQKLRAFFDEYSTRTNRALADPPQVDVEATTSAFADCFIEASPLGVNCGKNDEDFRQAIPKGLEFYRSIGTKAMNIASLKVTPLDDYHWQVNIHWVADYRRQDNSEETIEFDVIYMVQVITDQPKIFAYITGDEEKTLRDRGLIPQTS